MYLDETIIVRENNKHRNLTDFNELFSEELLVSRLHLSHVITGDQIPNSVDLASEWLGSLRINIFFTSCTLFVPSNPPESCNSSVSFAPEKLIGSQIFSGEVFSPCKLSLSYSQMLRISASKNQNRDAPGTVSHRHEK